MLMSCAITASALGAGGCGFEPGTHHTRDMVVGATLLGAYTKWFWRLYIYWDLPEMLETDVHPDTIKANTGCNSII